MAELLRSIGPGRLAAMAGMTAGLLLFFGFIIFRITEPSLSPLYPRLDPADAGEIVSQLESLGINYKLKGDGTVIMVPNDRVLRLRMSLAEQGLPSGGSVGYEIFDKAEALGTTSFVQNLNHLRALEGELARTIRAIDNIATARVHLVIPKRELFSRDTQQPSASILLGIRGVGLERAQIKAIQHLVASAVHGLSPEHISIIDERGTPLASGMPEEPGAAGASTADERTLGFENRLKRQIEDLVSRIVGIGKTRAQVTAQLDFSRITESSETFDPEGRVERSIQTVEESSANSEREADASVSVANEIPDADVAEADDSPTSSASNNRTEETVNYEISKTTKTQILEAGSVKRISAAVLVDGTYTEGANGERVYTPRSDEELEKISKLVKSTIGFDEQRGDQLEIINMQFADLSVPEATAPEEPMFGLHKEDYFRIGELAVLGIVSILLVLLVFRPLMASVMSPPEPAMAGVGVGADGTPALPGAVPDETMAALPEGQAAPQLPGPTTAGAPAGQLPGPEFTQSDTSRMIDIAQVEGQVKESSVKKVGEIVQTHPEEAVAIMRNWMYSGD